MSVEDLEKSVQELRIAQECIEDIVSEIEQTFDFDLGLNLSEDEDSDQEVIVVKEELEETHCEPTIEDVKIENVKHELTEQHDNEFLNPNKKLKSENDSSPKKSSVVPPILSIKLPDVLHLNENNTTNTPGSSRTLTNLESQTEGKTVKDSHDEGDNCDEEIGDDFHEMKATSSDNNDEESGDESMNNNELEFNTSCLAMFNNTDSTDTKPLTRSEQEKLKQTLQEEERERMQ